MQSPALLFALILLGIGVCLNTAVLAYFAVRIARDGVQRRRARRGSNATAGRPALVPAAR